MLEYNVRAGTIIGYVGAGGIGTLLYTYQEFYQWSRFAAVLCFILIIVTILDLAGSRLRAALTGTDTSANESIKPTTAKSSAAAS
jgi:phosphonate transport system permease protein